MVEPAVYTRNFHKLDLLMIAERWKILLLLYVVAQSINLHTLSRDERYISCLYIGNNLFLVP